MGPDPRRQRHRVPRRDRQLHHRERALLRGVRQALHECAGDHLRRVPRHRGSRRALLRLGSRQGPVRHLELAVQGHGDAQLGRGQRAGLRRARRAGGPRRSRRRPVARRASGGGRDAAASELRLPTGEEALPAVHAGARRRPVRLQRRGLPAGCGEPSRGTRAPSERARSVTPSAGRSTRSACSTSAPPRSSSSCSGTWAGRAAAFSRYAVTRRFRARRTSRRSTTSSRGICRCPTPRPTATSSTSCRRTSRRPASGDTSSRTG